MLFTTWSPKWVDLFGSAMYFPWKNVHVLVPSWHTVLLTIRFLVENETFSLSTFNQSNVSFFRRARRKWVPGIFLASQQAFCFPFACTWSRGQLANKEQGEGSNDMKSNNAYPPHTEWGMYVTPTDRKRSTTSSLRCEACDRPSSEGSQGTGFQNLYYCWFSLSPHSQ